MQRLRTPSSQGRIISFSRYKSRVTHDQTVIGMRKESRDSNAHTAGKYIPFAFTVTVLVFVLLAAGCTTSQPAPAPATTMPVTTVQTTVATPTVITTTTIGLNGTAVDQAFIEAADACYRKTPVITNLSTHLEFATCMKNTPLPLGNCARNFRYYALKHTNEDASSAGFAREMENLRLAREAYLRGEGYDGTRLEYVPCGDATLIKTSILT